MPKKRKSTDPCEGEKSPKKPARDILPTSGMRSRLHTLHGLWNSDRGLLYSYFEEHETELVQLVASLQSMTLHARTSTCIREDPMITSQVHPAMLQTFKPITTSMDGNCLWNAVSILLCGSEALSVTLRVVTLYSLVKHQSLFLRYLSSGNLWYDSDAFPTAESRYVHLLGVASTIDAWGEDCHMQALSLVLNTPLFCYTGWRDPRTEVFHVEDTLTPQELASLFNQGDGRCHFHTLYCTPEQYYLLRTGGVSALQRPPLCIQ